MIPKHLSAMWTALAPALGNHLWQSTLFAIAAGLLTLALRKNHARVRYWVWLAASVRFLIPFSLLVGIGSHLAWSRDSAGTNAGLYFAMEEISQPFTQPATSVISRATPLTIVSSSLIQLLPALLEAVWLCGFLVVVFVWYLRWRRVSIALRNAEPLREGREVEMLRRLERLGGRRKRIEFFLSPASLEPGIFGIGRPVLVWPKGISERLGDAHLEAILAHEVWHVRRRDNLAAALHMFVEAVFWFHPLVWWLGARLVEERERACDEAVLESGSDRQIYAESILKICEFCVGSPLACISGVSGADLKNRIARIMTERVARQLDFSRKLLLSAAGLLAVAVPIAIGLLSAMQTRAQSQAQSTATIVPKFEVASIKPNNGTPMAGFSIVGKPFAGIMWRADRFMATNVTLHGLIRRAYDVQDDQILGGPDWLTSEGYDLDAKVEKSLVDEQLQKLGPDQWFLESKRMLQALLANRFKLSLHSETKEVPVYALIIAANGPKIQRAISDDAYPTGFKRSDGTPIGAGNWSQPGKFVGQGVPIASLVQHLSEHYLHRAVLDKTGLSDKYDFTLQWTPPESEAAIFTAIQEQLGLKLESQKGPMQILVIDHAERPSEPQAQNAPAISPVSEAVSPKPNKSDNPPVGINSQPQNTAAVAPSYEIASIKPNKFNNPTGRIESQAQNTTVIEPRYEVASIKPNKSTGDMISLMGRPDGFIGTNITLQMLIRNAYEVEDNQISGGPSWIESEKYDIEAKMDGAVADELRKLGEDQSMLERQRMLQALLADRFKLSIHFEAKEGPAYALVIAKNGPKLQEAKPGESYANGIKGFDGLPIGPRKTRMASGELTVQALPMVAVARLLSMHLGRTVLDKTGLMGSYDFTLLWTPEEGETAVFNGPKYSQVRADSTRPDSSGPSIFAAIQEQLGLKLESQKGPVKFLVIDHVEMPSAN